MASFAVFFLRCTFLYFKLWPWLPPPATGPVPHSVFFGNPVSRRSTPNIGAVAPAHFQLGSPFFFFFFESVCSRPLPGGLGFFGPFASLHSVVAPTPPSHSVRPGFFLFPTPPPAKLFVSPYFFSFPSHCDAVGFFVFQPEPLLPLFFSVDFFVWMPPSPYGVG